MDLSFIQFHILLRSEDYWDLKKGPQTAFETLSIDAAWLSSFPTPCCSILLGWPLQLIVAAELIAIIHLILFGKHKSSTAGVDSHYTGLAACLNVHNFLLHIPLEKELSFIYFYQTFFPLPHNF